MNIAGAKYRIPMLVVLTTIIAIVFFIPLLWAISSSLKGPTELYDLPIKWIPEKVRLMNYIEIWQRIPLARFFLNTAIVTGFAVMGIVLGSAVVAYGFSWFDFPGKNVLFFMMLSTLMLPLSVYMVPRYFIFAKLGWVDTFLPLIVPWLGGGPFAIFLMRQFFSTQPQELKDAATIDGCGSLRFFVAILLPITKPAMAAMAIIAFQYHWNDFLRPLIYLNTTSNFTLALGLRFFQQTQGAGGEPLNHLLMGACLVMAAPIVVFFIAAQKQFFGALAMTGLKG